MTEGISTGEVIELAKQLNTILVSDDEYKQKVEKLKSTRKKIEEQHKRERQCIKECIEDMSQLGCGEDKEKGQIDALCSEESKLLSQTKAAQDSLDEISKKCQELSDKLSKVQKKEQQYLDELDQVKSGIQGMVERRHDVGLYTSITKIRWIHDSGPDHIKGFVCNKSDITPFDLNKKEHSKFYITNYLWDLIEEDW